MHDPSKRGLKHHGNTRADGDHDHHPVQIGYQAQQITGEHTQTHTHMQGLVQVECAKTWFFFSAFFLLFSASLSCLNFADLWNW